MRKITLFAAALILTASVSAQSSLINTSKHQKTGNISALKSSSRSMTGMITPTNNYVAGTTMDLTFELTIATPDFEYGDSLAMIFPAGITINAASDPFAVATEGQTDEALNSPIMSPTVSWGDNDNSYGGIEPGTHAFFVNVTIPAGQTGAITINWHLDGDEYGAAPNFLTGTTNVNALPTVADIALVAASDNKYYSIPASLPRAINFSAELVNNGAALTSATNATVDIPGASYSESTALTVPFATNATQSVSWANPASLTTVGAHDIYFDVTNPGDFNPADNKDTLMLVISDSVYSYMDTITDGSFGIGDGSDGMLGSVFDVPVTMDLNSISYYSPTPDPTASVSFVVYEVDASGPTNVLVFESDTFANSGNGPTIYNRPAGVSLTGGNKYFIGLRESVAGNMSMGQSGAAYYMDSHYAYFQGAWMEVGGAGFAMGFSIFANFDDGINSVNEIAESNLSVYPNPTNGIVNIAYNKQAEVSVYTMDGTMVKVVTIGAGSSEVNLSSFPKGIYILKVASDEGTSVKRIVLTK